MKRRLWSGRAGMFLLAAGTVVAAGGLAGCGSDGDDAGATAVAPSPTVEESASEAASPTPEPTTTEPTPEFTPLAPEDAADGADVGACADGECEVAVTAGTSIPFDPGTGGVTVDEVGESQVTA
ncbi:hypothetical protein E1265_16750 [Streptomyces sp. 8K308]|uniref:hypothetical protein n=1 Tax=Streptomyces sp. 8K308 TaxID=2530388 RepID=UPI001049AF7B|nr:hypothetical protein [Streptomyces sp. 8K308]TDC21950.1 hypothetical protein E1265_16750 [Streptomyces sp. 8K308]